MRREALRDEDGNFVLKAIWGWVVIAAGGSGDAVFGHKFSGAFTLERYFLGSRIRSMRSAAAGVTGPCCNQYLTAKKGFMPSRAKRLPDREGFEGFMYVKIAMAKEVGTYAVTLPFISQDIVQALEVRRKVENTAFTAGASVSAAGDIWIASENRK